MELLPMAEALSERGEDDPHWPSFENCALCHHCGYDKAHKPCRKLQCVIAGRGICGEPRDLYELATSYLRQHRVLAFRDVCMTIVQRLQTEYILYLTRDDEDSLLRGT
jgi:hypothetical protein